MKFNKIFIVKYLVLLALLFSLPSASFAATSADIGFISSNIWYSKDSLSDGETVKIYSAVWNGSSNIFEGKVSFYDKDILLGERNVKVSPENIGVAFVDWNVTAGDHKILAKISEAVTINGNEKTNVVIDNSVTPSLKETVLSSFNDPNISSSNKSILKSSMTAPGVDLPLTSSSVINFVKDKVPQSVSDAVSGSSEKVDSWRLNKLGLINAQLENSNPDQKVKNTAYKTASFVFQNKNIFYGLLLAAIIAIIVLLKKRIFKRND